MVVADDHPMFREGLAALFEAVPDVEVVGRVRLGRGGDRGARRPQPDVVIMDLQMPGMSGIDATRQIVGTSPHIGVLVVTMFDADESVFAAMRAGARGYVLKGAGHDEILRAVRTVAAGEAIFGSALARRLIGYFSGAGGPSAVPFGNLTQREREVLDKVAAGRSNAGSRRDLGLSREDGPQPPVEHLREAAGGRPGAGDRAGPRGGIGGQRHGPAGFGLTPARQSRPDRAAAGRGPASEAPSSRVIRVSNVSNSGCSSGSQSSSSCLIRRSRARQSRSWVARPSGVSSTVPSGGQVTAPVSASSASRWSKASRDMCSSAAMSSRGDPGASATRSSSQVDREDSETPASAASVSYFCRRIIAATARSISSFEVRIDVRAVGASVSAGSGARSSCAAAAPSASRTAGTP